MTAEQQLERSVLESKERDELHAIAQAMSLKTTTRSKKADIIDQILEAAGVKSNGDEPAPGRSSGRSTNGSTNHTNHSNGSTARPYAEADEHDDEDEVSGNGRAPAIVTAVSTETLDDESLDTESLDDEALDASSGNGTTSNGASADGEGDYRPANARTAQQRQGARHPGQQQPQHNNAMAGTDPGNRRGRRRRGRERAPGGERELQGNATQDSAYQGDLVEVRGLLDLRDEGYGFVRCDGYLPSAKDVYVSISQARRFALRKGDFIEGAYRPASNNEKYPALLRIDTVAGLDPDAARNRPRFEDLPPLFPDSKLVLERAGEKDNLTARIVDLLSPIGKGQRGLIVSPPKAGKTTVMKQIAHSIEANNPGVHLMVLLVAERPEEVTDMRRSISGGEVVASTFDRPSEEHTMVAEMAIERAKRLVELGTDVVILLDGITRLARAYNLAAPATGRIMSGGVDSGALYPPKKFFGAARNIEEGGSLTILATALVETGSKMDEVIFEEFKGTGNMELRLDRRLAERRLYPSIDVNASSTRHEELLFDRGQLAQVWKLRRVLNALANEGNAAPGLELLMDKIRTTKSNDEFLAEIAKGPTPNG